MSVRTPKFRVSFPHLHTPTKFKKEDGDSTAKYSMTMVFDKKAQESKAYKELIKACKSALKEKFGDKAEAIWKKTRSPVFRPHEDMGEKSQKDFDDDVMWARAKSKNQPELIDRKGGETIYAAADFYPGCYAIATVNPYAYDYNGTKGVSLWINSVVKMDDGERIGTVQESAKTEFDDLIEEADPVEDEPTTDSTAADDDDW